MTDHPAFRSRAADVLSWDGHVRRLLAVEAALARAQASLGIIPPGAADAIAAACEGGVDRSRLDTEAAEAATPVIPLVRLLREAVGDEHAAHVHHGATSQDIIDTALVLQVRDAVAFLIEELAATGARCAELAEQHRDTVMAGRTLQQHAVPVTFGLKAAHWLAMISRAVSRLRADVDGLLVQFGGAAGTLAPFGERGIELSQALADELALDVPDLPWHTDRDVLHAVAADVGLVAGSLGKIALDVTSLMQTEVGELVDPGAGGSSTMPHKANPVDPAFALAAARLAVSSIGEILAAALQEHERAAGAWQSEWVSIPRLLDHAVASATRVRSVLGRVEVDAAAMARNLGATAGAITSESLTLALAPTLGRSSASQLVAELVSRAQGTGHDLVTVARADDRVNAILDADQLGERLDPARYLGSTDAFIERALASWAATAGDELGVRR